MKISVHPTVFNQDGEQIDNFYGAKFYKDFEQKELTPEVITTSVWSPIIFKDGYRSIDNFLAANYCVLDFDSGEYTLHDALNEWCDSIHIIGTTKSHRKEKNGNICDRFRLITPWESPINSAYQFSYNMSQVINRYGADNSCKDGARFYYPCTEIISVNEQGYSEEVKEVSEPIKIDYKARIERKKELKEKGIKPLWVHRFLTQGVIPPWEHSRNWTVFKVAKELLEMGYNPAEIKPMIAKAPFDRSGFKENYIDQRIKSAVKKIERNLREG